MAALFVYEKNFYKWKPDETFLFPAESNNYTKKEGANKMKIFTGKRAKEEKVEQLLLENYDRYYRLAFSYVHNADDAGVEL